MALRLGDTAPNFTADTTEGKIDQLPEAISALHVSITLLPAAVLGLAIVGLVLVYRRSLANVQSAAL